MIQCLSDHLRSKFQEEHLLLAKFTPCQPQQHSTSATLSSLLLANANRPLILAGGGPKTGHSLRYEIVDPGQQHCCF